MKCNVCNHEFTPNKENRYVASQQTAPMFGLAKYYDCFDCPVCGCQIVAQERKERLDTEADFVEAKQGENE